MANNKLNQWTLTFLRIVLGFIFTYHGYAKLFPNGGFVGTVNFFTSMGIAVPKISALVVAVVEFVGGILLLLGIITRWTSLAILFEMFVAFFMVHLKNGFFVSKGGYEYVIIILAALVVIFINGAGKISLGKMFKSRWLH